MTNVTSIPELTMVNLLTVVTPTALDNSSVSTTRVSRTSVNALTYIVVVLFFYSVSLVILMVKYVRREKEEADLRHYYYEFVSRDRFHSPRFQNKVYMDSVLQGDAVKGKPVQEINGNTIICNGALLQDEAVVVKLLPSRDETLV